MRGMDTDTITTLGTGLAIVAFIWRVQFALHKDIGKLAERVAKIEGLLEARREPVAEPPA